MGRNLGSSCVLYSRGFHGTTSQKASHNGPSFLSLMIFFPPADRGTEKNYKWKTTLSGHAHPSPKILWLRKGSCMIKVSSGSTYIEREWITHRRAHAINKTYCNATAPPHPRFVPFKTLLMGNRKQTGNNL